MAEMHAMMARTAQPGLVTWMGVRPGRRVDMVSVDVVRVTAQGLSGDHARPGKRAVTFMQAEHLSAIGAYLGQGPVTPAQVRRNLVVGGLNLASLKGRTVAIGSAVVRMTTICAPCSRMEEVFGHGGYAAVRGHGGWCAEVVQEGDISCGDLVRPVD